MKEMNEMKIRYFAKRLMIIILSILFLSCCVFAVRYFTKDFGQSKNKDVEWNIGVVGSGSKYTAKIELKDARWKELTADQRNNIVEECLDTADLEDSNNKQFKMIGIDKTTNKKIFTYDSITQNTNFCD